MLRRRVDVFMLVVMNYLGSWYSWGGDDPEGFDCSGLVVEGLKSCGVLERGTDYTAQGLFDKFNKVELAETGNLAFWGTDGRVEHVEVCMDRRHSIGASGGGSGTSSKADAVRDNAFVKIRPIERKRELIGYVNPFDGGLF